MIKAERAHLSVMLNDFAFTMAINGENVHRKEDFILAQISI